MQLGSKQVYWHSFSLRRLLAALALVVTVAALGYPIWHFVEKSAPKRRLVALASTHGIRVSIKKSDESVLPRWAPDWLRDHVDNDISIVVEAREVPDEFAQVLGQMRDLSEVILVDVSVDTPVISALEQIPTLRFLGLVDCNWADSDESPQSTAPGRITTLWVTRRSVIKDDGRIIPRFRRKMFESVQRVVLDGINDRDVFAISAICPQAGDVELHNEWTERTNIALMGWSHLERLTIYAPVRGSRIHKPIGFSNFPAVKRLCISQLPDSYRDLRIAANSQLEYVEIDKWGEGNIVISDNPSLQRIIIRARRGSGPGSLRARLLINRSPGLRVIDLTEIDLSQLVPASEQHVHVAEVYVTKCDINKSAVDCLLQLSPSVLIMRKCEVSFAAQLTLKEAAACSKMDLQFE